MIAQNFLFPDASTDIYLPGLGLNLLLVLLFGHILGWHFVRYGQVLSNKRKLARVLVIVSATTLLIITVVKVSLALSLGLVGAMSIIRFRTPVKEPEELAYLFLGIAVGVGLGADRRWETALVFVVILAAMALRSGLPGGRAPILTILQVTRKGNTGGGAELDALLPAVSDHCKRVDLRRVDCHDDEFHASLLVELATTDRLQGLLDSIRTAVPGASVSVVERDGQE